MKAGYSLSVPVIIDSSKVVFLSHSLAIAGITAYIIVITKSVGQLFVKTLGQLGNFINTFILFWTPKRSVVKTLLHIRLKNAIYI